MVTAKLYDMHAAAPLLGRGDIEGGARALLEQLRDGPGLPSAELGESENDHRGAAAANAFSELPAEERELLLRWAHAHSVLHPVFTSDENSADGPATIRALMANPLNASHFAALRAMAQHVRDLRLVDEAYLAPLCDLDALGTSLAEDAWLAKALHEALCVYATGRGVGGAGRRSNRRAR